MQTLQLYHWPGNIRELRNVIEQAIIISGREYAADTSATSGGCNDVSRIRHWKKESISMCWDVLSKTGWRIKGPNGAAELLGLKPSTLFSRMKKLGISNRRTKGDKSSQR